MPKPKYQRIVFLQGDEADEALKLLDEAGYEQAIDYLAQWDHGDALDDEDEPVSGDSDDVWEDGRYRMSWNTRLNYIGLEFINLENVED